MVHVRTYQEEELVIFLFHVAQIGHGRTRREVIAIVERILSSRGNSAQEQSPLVGGLLLLEGIQT